MAAKREIDKENMFRKIMPSAAAQRDAEAAAAAPAGQDAGTAAQQAGGAPPPQDAGRTPSTGRILSRDEIAAMFAQQNAADGGAPVLPAPPGANAPGAQGSPTQQAANALVQQAMQKAPNAGEAQAGQIQAGLAQAAPTEAAATQQAGGAPPPQDAGRTPSTGRILSRDEIAAMFAQQDAADGGAPVLPAPPGANAPGAQGSPTQQAANVLVQQAMQKAQDAGEAQAGQVQAEQTPSVPAEAAQTQLAEAAAGEAVQPLPYPVNLAEILVNEYYPRYRQRLNACPCQHCKDDSCGMALNRIKPRYVPSDRLNDADLGDRALITETVTALIQAILKVKRSPHHSEFEAMRHG